MGSYLASTERSWLLDTSPCRLTLLLLTLCYDNRRPGWSGQDGEGSVSQRDNDGTRIQELLLCHPIQRMPLSKTKRDYEIKLDEDGIYTIQTVHQPSKMPCKMVTIMRYSESAVFEPEPDFNCRTCSQWKRSNPKVRSSPLLVNTSALFSADILLVLLREAPVDLASP